MKTQKRVFRFQLFLILILGLSIFWKLVFNQYILILILFSALFLFNKFFGFEKRDMRYTREILEDVFLYLLGYFIFFYLLGLLVGFNRSDRFLNIMGIIKICLPTVIVVFGKELLRNQILLKIDKSLLSVGVMITLFVLIDIFLVIGYVDFFNKEEVFNFLALVLFPSISLNLAFSYISYNGGYKPCILYRVVMDCYPYFLYLLPNPSKYLSALIAFIGPLVVFYIVYEKMTSFSIINMKYRKTNFLILTLTLWPIVILIYLVSGYFRFQVVAIASGSMNPSINIGDAIVIEKDRPFEHLKVGDIIAYEYAGKIVVHRLVDFEDYKGIRYYYTKGDANTERDQYYILEEKILGVVKYKIPWVGLPTVWLHGKE